MTQLDVTPDGAVQIPLRAKDGSIRAYAVVDAADADFVNRWRWSLSADGYAVRSTWIGGRRGQHVTYFLHRELLGLSTGDGVLSDHVDRDRLNNRRSNLRKTTKKGNLQNRSSVKGSSSRYRGVSWIAARRKWRAALCVDGVKMRLGDFDDEEEANRVVREARRRLMPGSVD